MIYLVPLLTIIAAGLFSLRSAHSKETRLVLTTTIHRPASFVFEVIGAVERSPVWRRRPQWLPGPLRISNMSRWGEHTPAEQRASGRTRQGLEEIWIRHVQNREFGYRSIRRRDLSYESTFQLSPGDGKCQLTWEIRYRVHRLPDILSQTAIAAAARKSMASSLEYIRRMALIVPDSVCDRHAIYEDRRGQIPAA
jgi:hypothetical protein